MAMLKDSFRGKSVLVTGAGRGIGKVLCKRLDELSCKVFALSRTKSTLDTLKGENPNIHVHCADLSNWTLASQVVNNLPLIFKSKNNLDYLVNNAGVMVYREFLDMTSESFDEAMNINVKSIFLLSQLIAKQMIEKGTGGSIVNVSSIASKITKSGCGLPYSLSKGTLDKLTKHMASSLGPYNIRVNSVNPAFVATDMGKDLLAHQSNAQEASKQYMARCPMKRTPTELEVANTIVMLLSNYSSMTTGQTISIDGGYLIN